MKVVIAGLGVAGANAARIIAAGKPGAQVEVYGAEPHLYYARPRLPAFLAGEIEQDALYFYPQSWYHERGITVHTGAAVARIDAAAHRLELAEGTRVPYDRLLVATGAHSFVPPIAGADLPGVFTLWTIEDVRRIQAWARGAERAVVIGGGLLGLEAARGLRVLGLGVTVLEFAPRLMPRQLDQEGSQMLQGWIERLGIAVRVGATTERIEGEGAVRAVALKSGEHLAAELVLIAAGGRANLQLAQASGLAVNRGIVVNGRLETSAKDVYAAGDVAEHAGTVYGIIPAAIDQARVAAANLAEIERLEYGGTVPTNTLKIVGLDLTSAGQTSGAGEGYAELRRAVDGERYMKLVVKDGRLVGAILLGHREKASLVSQAVAGQVPVGERPERMLDEGFEWKGLVG